MFFKFLKDHVNHSNLVKRAYRLPLKSYNKFTVQFKDIPFDVRDVSSQGLSILNNQNNDLKIFSKNKEYEILLLQNDKNLKVNFEVRYIDQNFLGGLIHDVSNNYASFIHKLFDDEICGLQAGKVDSTKLKPHELGIPTWYFFNNSHELYTVEKEGRICCFYLSILGIHFDYNENDGIRFSQINESEFTGLAYKQSHLLEPLAKVNPEVIIHALKFVDNIMQLPELHKEQIKGILNWCMGNLLQKQA